HDPINRPRRHGFTQSAGSQPRAYDRCPQSRTLLAESAVPRDDDGLLHSRASFSRHIGSYREIRQAPRKYRFHRRFSGRYTENYCITRQPMTLRGATERLPRKSRASGSGYTDRKTVMAEKLTETLIKSLIPPARGERYVYDAELTGFALKLFAPTKANRSR